LLRRGEKGKRVPLTPNSTCKKKKERGREYKHFPPLSEKEGERSKLQFFTKEEGEGVREGTGPPFPCQARKKKKKTGQSIS